MQIFSKDFLIKKLSLFTFIFLFFHTSTLYAQLFQQDFNSGAFTPATIDCNTGAIGVTDNTVYRNSTNPSNTQFTYINTSTGASNCGTSISINTSTGKLEVVKTAKNAYLPRSFPFPNNTTSALVRFDFEVLANTSSNSGAFNFYIGDTIPDGNSSSSYRFHTNFKIGIDASGSLGWRVNSTGAFVSGSRTILLAVNNSGGTLNYLGPNGTCESVGDDKFDLWIGNVRYVNEGSSSLNEGQTLRRFSIVSNSGPASTCTFDNILIDPIPPTPTVLPETPLTGGGIGFTANWVPVSGVTGYFVDIADDNTFTTNLNTVYVAGAATGSYAFSSLTLGNTYYYRVRSASQYTIGTYQSCNSGTESGLASTALSFSAQPSNISQCLGVANALSVSSTQANSYQWYSNNINANTGGTLIGGATGTTYTPPSSVAGTTYYYCVIGNGSVELASNVATVRVEQSPTLSGVSQSTAVCGGQNATILLTGLVSGSLNNVYYHVGTGGALLANNVAEIGGGNGSFLYATTNASNGDVIFIDSIKALCTTLTNLSVTLIVNPTPSNPTGATNGSSCVVGTLNVSVSAPSTGFTTNWYNVSTGGSILSGGSATNSFTTPSFSSDTTAIYYAETYSSTTGCSSPVRVAVTASVAIPVFTFSSNTIYSPIPVASLYNVNLPYTSATGFVDQYDIIWTGATSGLFTPVTNGVLPGSTANNIVVPLNASAIAGTYTGSIRVKRSLNGCTSNWVPFTLVLIPVAKGDLGSVANGIYTTSTTWRMYGQNSGRFDSINASPTAATNLWIIDGYTVTAPTGGNCRDLHVINGRLKSGNAVSRTGVSIAVTGGVIEVASNGYFGTRGQSVPDTADALSLNIQNVSVPSAAAPVTSIFGTGGYIDIGRLIITGANDSVVIDHDMTINFKGTNNNGYEPACYFNGANQKLYIKPSRIVTFDKWSNFSVGSTPANYTNVNSYSLYVDGTLNFTPGIPSTTTLSAQQTFAANNGYLCMNSGLNSGTFRLIIGSTGTVNATELYANGLTALSSLNTISIASGGKLNVDSLADFRKASQTVIGAGTFNLRGSALMRIGATTGIAASGATGQIQTNTRSFSTSGRYSYESRSAQVTGDGIPSTIGALIVRDTLTTLTLSKTIRVTDSIRFNHGRLVLDAFNINTGSVKNFKDTNYIVTNGVGSLKIRNVGSTDVIFPVGPSTTVYNPVTLNNIGTPDTFAVKVAAGAPIGVAVSPRLDSAINKNWTIVEDVQGGSNVTVTPQWVTADANAQFLNSYCAVIHSNGSIIDAAGSVGPAVGTSPFTKYGSSFTSFLSTDKFGVSTSPKKFRSRDSGPWNEATSWDLYNASGGYSNSEVDFPSTIPYDVIIQNTHTINTVSGTAPVANNLQIDGLLSTLSDDISIHGSWTRSATGGFDHNNKIVKFVGTSDATISANGAEEFFPFLTLSKTALANKLTLLDNIKIGRELKITSGTLDLSSKNITLQSDANNTASFASFPASGAAINYSSTGRFVVHRYIHTGTSGTRHSKSWQLLCAPIDPAENVTIKQAWMENSGNNLNPNPGFGTQVVGPGGAANGFDQATVSTSLKVFDATNNVWAFVPNTSQNVSNDKGYMLFVRGSRAVTTINGTPDSTILRATGKLLTGSINGPSVPANAFQSVANPYASAINYNAITKSNLQGYIWVFDPNIGGTTYGLGRFNAIDVTTGAPQLQTAFYSNLAQNTLIQSGQAFLVKSNGSVGSISFKESDKVSGSRLVLRENQSNTITIPSVRSTVSFLDTDGRYKISDGNFVMFDESFVADETDDALKYFNTGDNFYVSNNGRSLAIEKRKPVLVTDTIHYRMLLSKIGNYNLKINVSNWANALTSAKLIDKFTNQITNVNLSDSLVYNFEINANEGSKANDRFLLVFDNALLAPLPVNFVDVKAAKKDEKSVLVNWTVSQEVNINKYEVEKSGNGFDFIKIGSVLALNNASTHEYDFIDEQPKIGVNYYRIRSVEVLGTTQLSKTVKIFRAISKEQFTVFPNPVTNNTITIVSNQPDFGKYFYQITDVLGRKIIEGEWLNAQGTKRKINFLKTHASGVYSLKISNELGETFSYKIYKK